MDFVQQFVADLRAHAADPYLGGSAEGRLLATIADRLERAYEAHQAAIVKPTQAAAESGYSRQQIHLLRRKGVISDRRGDLPRKPGHGVIKAPSVKTDPGARSLTDEVLLARRNR
jgi:hypothetical protein